MPKKAQASKQDIYAQLAQMNMGDTRYFRYADLNFTQIGYHVHSYGGRHQMRFKVEADFYKGLGVTRIPHPKD